MLSKENLELCSTTDNKLKDYAIVNGCEILNLNNVRVHGSITLGVRTSAVNPNEADLLFDVSPDVLISAHYRVSLNHATVEKWFKR